jgi:hypothetical protein
VWVLAGFAAVAVAACGSASTTSPSSSSNLAAFDPTNFNTSSISWLSANVNKKGTPPTTPTGTLKLAGSTDVSGMLDPQAEYDTIGYTVLTALPGVLQPRHGEHADRGRRDQLLGELRRPDLHVPRPPGDALGRDRPQDGAAGDR